jgi:acyl carrier protein
VLLKEVPLSPNGKIDRGALPTPSLAKVMPVSDPPQTETEKVVAGIFSRILATEHVGLNDNFFNLGGHSLLVTQVIAAINDTFQTQFQVADFYKDPTVTGIVKVLEEVKPVTECQAAS